MDEEQGIYRGEVRAIMIALSTIGAGVDSVLDLLEGGDDDEEEEEGLSDT